MANWTLLADWRALVLAGCLTPASSGCASAVDLPPAPALPAATASSEEFSGWYLRGDVGAGFEPAPDLGTASAVAPGIALPVLSPFAASSFGGATLTPSGTVDAGVGYVLLPPWLRMDGTLEYRFGARLQSFYAISDPAPLAGAGSFRAADQLRAGVSSIVALVNGYVDLGDYWGAKPFVGAGIGVADNALSGVSDRGFAVLGAGAAVPVGGVFSNASRTNFAWALTAGLDFDITPDLKLEISYRYLNLGSIAVGGVHCFPGVQACLGGAGGASSRNTLASSDVRIGLIWLVPEPQSAPAPVVASY
jgi:opacity protein-like surface antigen